MNSPSEDMIVGSENIAIIQQKSHNFPFHSSQINQKPKLTIITYVSEPPNEATKYDEHLTMTQQHLKLTTSIGFAAGHVCPACKPTKDEIMYGLFFLLLGYCMPCSTGAHCLLIDQNCHTNNN